jgi:hypothetical protein
VLHRRMAAQRRLEERGGGQAQREHGWTSLCEVVYMNVT